MEVSQNGFLRLARDGTENTCMFFKLINFNCNYRTATYVSIVFDHVAYQTFIIFRGVSIVDLRFSVYNVVPKLPVLHLHDLKTWAYAVLGGYAVLLSKC
jgi:hypothetical protein